jgi:aminoglycoside phosphotransferase (APT) family kinase protein
VLGARFGRFAEPNPIGSSGKTWLLQCDSQTLVLKRFDAARPLDVYVQLFEQLHKMSVGPQLRDVIQAQEEWYAAFEFVVGDLPPSTSAGWDRLWRQAVALLRRLGTLKSVPASDLSVLWMKLLRSFDFHDAPAELLKHRLLANPVPGPFGLAHGDFSPQNFVSTSSGLMLIDWEEAGRAPIAFDAGWLLVLGELGLTPRRTPLQLMTDMQPLDLEPSALRWSFRIGLLRLLWRARTMELDYHSRTGTITRLRQLISNELENPA